MAELTPGKLRGLATTSSSGGVFTILAIDHRDAMRAVLQPVNPEGVDGRRLTDLKLWLLAALGDVASGILLDPEYSAAQAIVTRTLSGRTGFLTALEAQGYLGDSQSRQTALLAGWSVEKAKRLGASGIKLLVLYRPDSPAAEAQDQMIAGVVADCADHDIALFLEPVAYAMGDEGTTATPQFAAKRRHIVVESARRLTALGPEVLKVQFPLDSRHSTDRLEWADACAELDAVTTVPWALLSGGDPYDTFRDQVLTACQAGASGFLVGRALWGDLAIAAQSKRVRLVSETVRPRFEELVAITARLGTDWGRRHSGPTVDTAWFRTY